MGELQAAGLAKLVPGRKFKFGRPPSTTTPELTTRLTDPDHTPTKFSQAKYCATEGDKRLMLTKIVEVSVCKVMRNHVYCWKNEYWLQSLGVPTGLRLSGIVGRLTMNSWRTRMRVLMAELWREREPDPNNLRYNFYEKKITNPRVMDKTSAMPHSMKMATLTQEGVRRLCNSSRELPQQERCNTLSLYMRKLQLSGYSCKLRSDILQAAVVTFHKKEKAEALGIVLVHRPGGHNLAQRRREKLLEKRDWPGRYNMPRMSLLNSTRWPGSV